MKMIRNLRHCCGSLRSERDQIKDISEPDLFEIFQFLAMSPDFYICAGLVGLGRFVRLKTVYCPV